jgi:hypothetical protein
MAASSSHEHVASEVLTYNKVDKSSATCFNCKLLEKQILDVSSELKSNKKIISMLCEDSTGNTTGLTADQQTSAFSCEPNNSECETSACGEASDMWIKVARNSSGKKRAPGKSEVNNQVNFAQTNRYALLSTTPENSDYQESTLHQGREDDCNSQINLEPTKITPIPLKIGRKISTIVNGQTLTYDNEEVKGSKWRPNNQARTHYLPPVKPAHKIEVLGDSHLIGTAALITENLDEKYTVCSLTQPGAGINQIVTSQEEILRNLGKNDAIIINGGSNDIEAANGKVSDILNPMVRFVQKYSNTNIVLINIPHRHDLWKYDERNLSIQAYNNMLKSIPTIFQHASLVENNLDWRFYTRQGFHLN